MTTLAIGKRLIPLEQIALVEPCEPETLNRLSSAKTFGSRIVLVDRQSILSEQAVIEIGLALGFRLLPDDGVATNPAVHFSVEAFEAAGEFKPTKPYRSRLLWRDQSGKSQSKLLLTAPEDVLSIAIRGEGGIAIKGKTPPRIKRSRKQTDSLTPA